MAINKAAVSAPVVWLLTDNKPGHRNQLRGLGNRLRVKAGASLFWINAGEVKVPLWRALSALPPALDHSLPRADLIVAAGSGTHKLLLSLRRSNARTLVLMKPGFPRRWIDGAIIPAHDGVPANRNTLITEGVINTVTPVARLPEKPEALILLGGPSPHFDWNNEAVLAQVTCLMENYPQWRWSISGSRRTPDSLRTQLAHLSAPHITVEDPDKTPENWLNKRMAASRAVWVTPDSMSMVCEAATSGVPTGLFQLPERSHSRVASGVQRLVAMNYVAGWDDHATVMAARSGPENTLWEADRAAQWVIRRWLFASARKTQQTQKRTNT